MKLLFENWRKYLTEDIDENNPDLKQFVSQWRKRRQQSNGNEPVHKGPGPYGTPTEEKDTAPWIRNMQAARSATAAALLKQAGLEMIRFVAAGAYTSTYEVRDLETQERLAAKITNHEPEREKYQWVKDHYDSFPPKLKNISLKFIIHKRL